MTDPAAILVVDDTPANRHVLARRLARHGYRVATASDGPAALEHLDAEPTDLVLLDWMMPGMDGLEVLARIRHTRSATALPVIMATAKDSTDDIVTALELGASDYVTKPLDFPVVLARVRTHLALKAAGDEAAGLRTHLAARNAELEAVAARLRFDLQAAARVQRADLPARPPVVPGLGFAWAFQPCDELAGDFYGATALGESAAAYLLDVSGHGVAAALSAVAIGRTLTSPPGDPDSLLTEADGTPTPPAEVLARLSGRFPFDPAAEQFFTMWYAVADGRTGAVRYASAGHPPALHVRPNGVTPLDAPGLPGGLGHEYTGHELTLAPGEVVLAYSDGVTEAAGPGGELFGVERLRRAVAAGADRSPAGLVEAVTAAVATWVGDGPRRDDVSVLAIGRVGHDTDGSRAGF